MGYNTYCHLFDSFVVPVQDYACEIWWNSNINIFFRNSPRPNIYSVCYLCAIIAQMSMYLCVIIAQMSMYLCVIIAQMKQAEIHNT